MQTISRKDHMMLAMSLDEVSPMLSPMHPYFEALMRSMPRAMAHVFVEHDSYDRSAAMDAVHAQAHTAGFVESGRMCVEIGQTTPDGDNPNAFAVEIRTSTGNTLVRAAFTGTEPDARPTLFFPGDSDARVEIAQRLLKALERAQGVALEGQRFLLAEAEAVFG